MASKLRIFFEGIHFKHEVIKERVILNEPSLQGTTRVFILKRPHTKGIVTPNELRVDPLQKT